MKVASRYLIPLELFLGVTMIAWAISGGFGRGYLFKLLEREGDNWAWLLTLSIVGLVQFAVGAAEWIFGRGWPTWQLRRWRMSVQISVWIRSGCAFLAGCVWLYICKLLGELQGMQHITVLAVLAPAGFIFNVWIVWENAKVACALNPNLQTSTLRFDR